MGYNSEIISSGGNIHDSEDEQETVKLSIKFNMTVVTKEDSDYFLVAELFIR